MSALAPSPAGGQTKAPTVTTRSRSQSQDAQSLRMPASMASAPSPGGVQSRRALFGAAAPVNSSIGRKQPGSGAGAHAGASSVPFAKMSPAAQVVALTDDEIVESVLFD